MSVVKTYIISACGIISKLSICTASNSVMLGLPNKFFGPAKLGRGTSRENHWVFPTHEISRDFFVEDL